MGWEQDHLLDLVPLQGPKDPVPRALDRGVVPCPAWRPAVTSLSTPRVTMAETGLVVKDAEAKKCVSARFLELLTAVLLKNYFLKFYCHIVNFFT